MTIANIVISAPFGNYFAYPGATSTLGTFTLHRRGGMAYRLWRCLRTLRYRFGVGWTNKLGLPNPGIESLDSAANYCNRIISIHGFCQDDWQDMATQLCHRARWVQYVELNLSCPNVHDCGDACDVEGAVQTLFRWGKTVIAKLPPLRWMQLAVPLYDMGVRHFHCCNTIPVPCGGLSGLPLKQYALWATEEIKQRWGADVHVIGGGGVTHGADYHDYKRAGADSVAIGSVLLNPLNWRRVRKLIEATQLG